MKVAKVLGYNVSKEHIPAGSEGNYYSPEHDEGHETNHIYVELEGDIYTWTITESYGSCGSGYCSASWGDTDNVLQRVSDMFGIELITPNKLIELNVVDDGVDKKIQIGRRDSEYYSDSMVTTVTTRDGEEFTSETGDGGCGYYPSGRADINENLFR